MSLWDGMIERITKRILDGQKYFWLNRKGETILTTGPYNLVKGKKLISVEIDWYEEKKPQYTRYANYAKFCDNHYYVGKL